MRNASFLIFAFAILLSGCDSNAVEPQGESRVSLSIASTALNQVSLSKSSHVSLSEVKILLREIQFHARDSESEGDSLDFRSEAIVVILDTDSTVTELQISDIPSGTYHKISFRIHKPDEEETPLDPEFKTGQGGQERFSVIARGQFENADFTYRSSKAMHQTISLEQDLVIDGTEIDPINLTLMVDVNDWFVGNGGQDLDPTATQSGATSQIDKSIRESFRIFKDQNRDGKRDN